MKLFAAACALIAPLIVVNAARKDRPGRGGRPDIFPGNVPDHVLEKWREKFGVKPGFKLQTRSIRPNKSIDFPDGTVVSMKDLEPLDVFTQKAECLDGESKILCPPPTVFSTKTKDGSRVIVSKDHEGNIEKIRVKRRNGSSQTLQAVDSKAGMFAHIPEDAVDQGFFARFSMKDAVGGAGNDKHRLLRGMPSNDFQRHLQTSCTSFREIQVAIAVESSLCAEIGASGVDAKVQSIMADVASDYEQDGLCFTAKISHYEKYCDGNNDPYSAGVALNLSGCSNYGLLDFFQEYWNNNRQNVHRDVAQLFSGTGLECDSDGCVIGCAYTEATCSSLEDSYGVNYVTFTSNAVSQSQLVSHEIGHVVGADHDSRSTNYIMYPFIGANEQYFSDRTIASFLVPRNEECFSVVGTNPTTTAAPPTTSVPPTTGNSVLQSGVPVTGISGNQGSIQYWTLPMPSNAQSVTCSISGGSGDADLYAQWDGQSIDVDNQNANQCAPWEWDSEETCTAADLAPLGSILTVAVHAYDTFSGLTLQCTVTVSGPPTTTTSTTSATTSATTTTSTTTTSTTTTTVPPTTTTTSTTNAPPPTGIFAIEIVVQHDNFADETSWSLETAQGVTLASQAENSGVANGATVTSTQSVGAGQYTFTINDSYGDGICCGQGAGSFSVKVNGKLVQSGGDFGSGTAVTFSVGLNQLASSGVAASEGQVRQYAMVPPDGTSSISCSITGNNGDADLYVSLGRPNDMSESEPTNDCVPYTNGSNESCPSSKFGSSIVGNVLFVSIDAYETFSGVLLTCTAS